VETAHISGGHGSAQGHDNRESIHEKESVSGDESRVGFGSISRDAQGVGKAQSVSGFDQSVLRAG